MMRRKLIIEIDENEIVGLSSSQKLTLYLGAVEPGDAEQMARHVLHAQEYGAPKFKAYWLDLPEGEQKHGLRADGSYSRPLDIRLYD